MADPTVDTLIEDPRWEAAALGGLAEAACGATLAHLGLDPAAHEISLLGCNDARIAALNAEFRGKPQPTNVLSWPSAELGQPGGHPREPDPGELGDIAMAYETCEREAKDAGLALNDHATHLIVHATLHLLGYDHGRDDDAALMQGLEIAILNKLGIGDPYDVSFGKD